MCGPASVGATHGNRHIPIMICEGEKVMTAATPEKLADEEFGELEELQVIDSSELKLGAAYHTYTYIAAESTEDIPD